jgi:signal transduction histidine kinase
MQTTPEPLPPPLPPFFDRRLIRLVPVRPDKRGFLAGMRVRKKLVVLHTVFSLALAGILLIALRPAITEVVEQAEVDEARIVLGSVLPALVGGTRAESLEFGSGARAISGSASELGIPAAVANEAAAGPGRVVPTPQSVLGPGAVAFTVGESGGTFHAVSTTIASARAASVRVYWLTVGALLAVYALVAVALELVVLPQNVYAPIQRLLMADRAVREGRKEEELIPAASIPDDELGEIMRSRNESIDQLRRQEAALADALSRLEMVANDLKRKNHLLETARRNLADTDRLASVGMMSAGIAHELNTPLAVLKGMVEKINADPGAGLEPAQAALMRRVVGRLERLGESLLDFARVRPPSTSEVGVHGMVREAATLVALDREARGVEIVNAVPEGLCAACDGDRMVQVLVNLIRNAVDAITTDRRGNSAPIRGVVTIGASESIKDGQSWIAITISDDGPGLDPSIIHRLFEPFATTRLDSRGTGLGLAVAEGIVREHGGMILARNRPDRAGAIFEVLLPRGGPSEVATPTGGGATGPA